MKITKLEPQKRHPNRYSIWVDGEFVVGVDQEVVLSLGLMEGLEIGKNELERIFYEESKRKTKEYAFTLLSYRARSKKELISRLKKRGSTSGKGCPARRIPIKSGAGEEDKSIDEVMAELEEVGLINDTEFARAWVRERGESRGIFKLRSELFTKGISKEIIDEVLGESRISEIEVAQNLTEHWLRSHKHLPEDVIRRRLFGFLARRGISYDTIKSLDIFKY